MKDSISDCFSGGVIWVLSGKKIERVCLLNDSFPPVLDGVANAVSNYAAELEKRGTRAMVVTPGASVSREASLGYPVVRYPGVALPGLEGYLAGVPFSALAAGAVRRSPPQIYHSHCPAVSSIMARSLRGIRDAPLVFTYHTKFDVEIDGLTSSPAVRRALRRALVENVSASDEVWAVSRGAGENLRKMGYCGELSVMQNGVDLPRGRAEPWVIGELKKGYGLSEGIPVYLFVGRLVWNKGIGLILDALRKLKLSGRDFRMVIVGSGPDGDGIRSRARELGIWERCVFVGAVRDRELLRGWYSLAELFVFPSTYDTNGLVVREAAACSLPSVLVRNSCAAEGIRDGINGFLTEGDSGALCALLDSLWGRRDTVRAVGERAMREIYFSWGDAVGMAEERYGVVRDKWLKGETDKKRCPLDGLWRCNGRLMSAFSGRMH